MNLFLLGLLVAQMPWIFVVYHMWDLVKFMEGVGDFWFERRTWGPADPRSTQRPASTEEEGTA